MPLLPTNYVIMTKGEHCYYVKEFTVLDDCVMIIIELGSMSQPIHYFRKCLYNACKLHQQYCIV